MTDPQTFLRQLKKNLNLLQERAAKYGRDVPLALVNQIEDHDKAITLTQQTNDGELTEAEWREGLKPLLLAVNEGQVVTIEAETYVAGDQVQTAQAESGGAAVVGDVGRDVIIYNYHYHGQVEVALPAALSDTDKPIPANPYRGLFTFRPEHAPFFFGRESFTRQLIAAVESRRLVTVLGASGSGKSSVVFAGLVPALVNRPGEPWCFTTFRPGDAPFQNLAAALMPLYETTESKTALLGATRDLAGSLRQGRYPLSDVLGLIHEARPDHRLLLIADQFEELYTLCRDADTRHAFLDLLLAVFHAEQSSIQTLKSKIIFTLRADFLGQASLYRPWADALQGTTELLGPMTETELNEAIEKPAKVQGVSFEVGLVETLLADVGQQAGSLPLLEFALSELWQHQTRRTLTHRAYMEIGQVEGALSRHADRAYAELSPVEQEQARRVFVQLVNPGRGTEDTRRLATRRELDHNWGLVAKLANERLVVTAGAKDEAGTQQDTVEVVHEALIRNWPQLRTWLDADREFLIWRLRLRADVRRWEEDKSDDGSLLRGGALSVAQEQVQARPADLTEAERLFIEASSARQRQRERQRQLLLIGVGVVAVVMTLLAFWGWNSAVRAGVAEGRALEQANVAATAKAQAEDQAMIGEERAKEAVTAEANAVTQAEIADQRADEAASAKATAEAERDTTQSLRQRMLKVQSEILLSSDPQLAVLTALEAEKVFRSDKTKSVLAKAPYSFPPLEATLLDHTQAVLGVAWSPDGSQLASGAADNTVRVWDLETSRSVVLNGHTDWVREVAWSPDGRQLASASDDKIVKIWDMVDRTALEDLEGHQDFVLSLAWSPDGKYLASGDRSGQVNVWDMTSSPGVTISLKPEHSAHVWGLAWSPDSLHLASASEDETIVLWDFTTSPPLTSSITGHMDSVWGVAWSPDGTQLASAGNDRDVIIWDVQTGQRLKTLEGHRDGVYDVAWSADGTRIASGSFDRSVIVWDVARGEPIQQFERHTDTVWSVAWSPDNTKLASAAADKSIFIWDMAAHQSTTLTEHDESVFSARWSPDGSRLASTSADGSVILRNFLTNESFELDDHASLVIDADWSPDGTQLASAGWDGDVIIWDGFSGDLVTRLEQDQSERLWRIDWSPKGDYIAAGLQDNRIAVWNVTNLTVTTPFTSLVGHDRGRVLDVAWSPDARYLASASDDHTVIIWDTETWSDFKRLDQHEESVFSVAWSPDRKFLASGADDDTVILWDVTDWEPTAQLTGHTAKILDTAWNKDGSLLATASGGDDNPEEANKIIIWDVATRQPITTLKGHSWWVWSVEWSPDQALLTSASDDSTIQLLNTKFLQPPCEWLTQNLSYSDWQKYLLDLDYPRTCPNLPIPSDVIEDAKNFARKGQIEEAIYRLNHLNQLDPTLAIDAETEAHQIFQEAFNKLIRELAEAEGSEATEAKFKEVMVLAVNRNSAEVWRRLCIEGEHLQLAESVKEACDKATGLEQGNSQ